MAAVAAKSTLRCPARIGSASTRGAGYAVVVASSLPIERPQLFRRGFVVQLDATNQLFFPGGVRGEIRIRYERQVAMDAPHPPDELHRLMQLIHFEQLSRFSPFSSALLCSPRGGRI